MVTQPMTPIFDRRPRYPRHLRRTAVLFLLLCLAVAAACTQIIGPVSPEGPEGAAAEMRKAKAEKDARQLAYENVALASLAMSREAYGEARQYLDRALEADPQSPYLCRKMALLLKTTEDYPAALEYALKLRELDPDGIESLTLLADLYMLTDKDDLAIEAYREIIAAQPGNTRIRLLIITNLIRREAYREALRQLDTVIDQNPKLVIAFYYRGRINLEIRNYEAAEAAYLKALKLNPGLEPALFDLGTLYQMTQREMDAIDIYKKLVLLNPQNLTVRERMVDLYIKLGLKEKAEQEMNAIKERAEPGDPERQALGLLYLRQGRLDESIEELKLILAAWPEDDKTRYYLGTAYEENKDLENALAQFRKIGPESKYFQSSRIHIAYILDSQGKSTEAIDVLESAIDGSEAEVELYLMLASLYEGLKKYDKGIEVAREGLKNDERNVDLLFRIGVLLDKKGDKEACLTEMRNILKIDPDHADALNYIGYTYAEKGIRLDEAMKLIKRALAIKPESGYILDSLGWVYFQKGQYGEALGYLEKAAIATPDDPTINEHLGDTYLKMERHGEAIDAYKKALSLEHPDSDKVKKKMGEVEQLLEDGR
ncbi:MAG: tetratricopeptide repeat protein [Deltaproteobacteria bacterium]|nr:tetratricopeptide repeat protein [Deltaproteobacteria bacterium]